MQRYFIEANKTNILEGESPILKFVQIFIFIATRILSVQSKSLYFILMTCSSNKYPESLVALQIAYAWSIEYKKSPSESKK